MFSVWFTVLSDVKKQTFTNFPEDVSKNIFCFHLFVKLSLVVLTVTTKTLKYPSWTSVNILSTFGVGSSLKNQRNIGVVFMNHFVTELMQEAQHVN